ncbi:Cold shock domain-containing protein 3, partial [Cucurbita argyrosperma subsp. sororia]
MHDVIRKPRRLDDARFRGLNRRGEGVLMVERRKMGIWERGGGGGGSEAPHDSGEDLFVHHTSILSDGFRTLFDGQAVEFSIDYGQDHRAKAVDVTVIGRTSGSEVAVAVGEVESAVLVGPAGEVVMVVLAEESVTIVVE